MNYYNDNNQDCVDQLRYLIEQGLIPNGLISSQDIRLVEACDLADFNQVHLFAGCGGRSWWDAEPEVARVADGLPAVMGPTIRMFGNAIVPPLAAEFIRSLYEARV